MKKIRGLLTCAVVFGLWACASTPTPVASTAKTPAQTVELSKLSLLILNDNKLILTPNTLFSWHDGMHNDGVVDKAAGLQLAADVQDVVDSSLRAQGVTLSADKALSNYSLEGWVIVDASNRPPLEWVARFGVDPGLTSSDNYGKGALLLSVRNTQTQALVWRGVVQLLMSDNNTDKTVRADRIQKAVEMLTQAMLVQ